MKNGRHEEGEEICWYLNDKRHREDGPAIEEYDGNQWYLNGLKHRENGPAVEYTNGSKEWCLNGRLHREDGPAIEDPDGSKFWFLNGENLTEVEFNHFLEKKNLNENLHSKLDKKSTQKRLKI